MQHIGNRSFGINWGSLTWVDFYKGHWWATFANYDVPYGPTKTPYGQKAATQMVTFTADFRYLESWVLPKVILDKFESLSNSGGSWGPDGHRYLSGRDLADFCKMRLPKAGSVLELVEVIAMNIHSRSRDCLGPQRPRRHRVMAPRCGRLRRARRVADRWIGATAKGRGPSPHLP